MKQWDIFCKIVDNFGDIGVCWRLARQLQKEHGLQIRLWIDDLAIAKQLIPALDLTQKTQTVQNINIALWQADTVFNQTAEVVIEAFGCELPASYLANMQASTIWINLEYLSAESWVEGFHAQNSKRGDLIRHFFFPGFTSATGGLLREHEIVKNNQALAINDQRQQQFLKSLNLENSSRLKVSLFCYPHAPIETLLNAMADSDHPTDCYVPASSILPAIAQFFSKSKVTADDILVRDNLHLHILPFLSQQDYDKLLACCDINFVRGEDSWIRAIWAGKPFIWQPYRQTEDTHLTKLNAFLELFYSGCDAASKQSARNAHLAWTAGDISAAVWQDYLSHLHTIQTCTSRQTNVLAAQADLATNLVIFSKKILKNILNNQV